MRFQATRVPLLQSKPKNLTAVRILVHDEHACWRTGAVLAMGVTKMLNTSLKQCTPKLTLKGPVAPVTNRSLVPFSARASCKPGQVFACLASPAEHGTQKPQKFASKGRKSRV